MTYHKGKQGKFDLFHYKNFQRLLLSNKCLNGWMNNRMGRRKLLYHYKLFQTYTFPHNSQYHWNTLTIDKHKQTNLHTIVLWHKFPYMIQMRQMINPMDTHICSTLNFPRQNTKYLENKLAYNIHHDQMIRHICMHSLMCLYIKYSLSK
jgi:hypothetical protein